MPSPLHQYVSTDTLHDSGFMMGQDGKSRNTCFGPLASQQVHLETAKLACEARSKLFTADLRPPFLFSV